MPKSKSEGITPRIMPISAQQIIKIDAVEALTQLSRETIYGLVKKGIFPPSIQLAEKARGWRLAEVEAYLASRPVPDADSWRPVTRKSTRPETSTV